MLYLKFIMNVSDAIELGLGWGWRCSWY